MVHTIIGKDCLPVSTITLRFRPKPKRMTAHCSIFFDVNLIPFFRFECSDREGMNRVISIPIKIANTGAPITSNEKDPAFKEASRVEIPAIRVQSIIPGSLWRKKFIYDSFLLFDFYFLNKFNLPDTVLFYPRCHRQFPVCFCYRLLL